MVNSENINSINFVELYSKLCMCTCKKDMIEEYEKVGIHTLTKRTEADTPNDLYIQFVDGSHFKFGRKRLALYTLPEVADSKYFSGYSFKEIHSDGKWRTRVTSVESSAENLKYIMSFFLKDKDNWVPGFLKNC